MKVYIVCVLLLLCALSTVGYTPYAGMRLTIGNKFVASAAGNLLPKLFESAHKMIKPPNSIFASFTLIY